ncbi:alpha/beta fold hydrolase [Rhodovarius crocodyli]|uniref:Alpha/beta fold hydrolase n=1 Tax=Rhodovarius crocodyli TaxID=1979269 RepID=A0A437M2U7_9PROT|nr:alpha/beta hydrolase [Rhodovarius crocodyli]RVT92017.1 alpha/beta fold hydrolase [Rhodovarius crocodyli]
MPFIEAGNSRLYHEVHGEGPPVVLMHGVGGNHAGWFNQVPAFARRHRTVVIDQRGFGLSTDAEGLGRSAMADDLALVLDHLGIERAAIVAQSMSGGAAVNFACRHPGRVSALVMADTAQGIALSPDLAAIQAEAMKAGEALTPIERVFGPSFLAAEPSLAFLYRQISGFNRYNARSITGAFPLNAPEALAATGIPILFLAGAEERRFPVPLLRGVQAQVAGSRFVLIERAGHSVYFERPDAFNEVVLGFLAEAA